MIYLNRDSLSADWVLKCLLASSKVQLGVKVNKTLFQKYVRRQKGCKQVATPGNHGSWCQNSWTVYTRTHTDTDKESLYDVTN